ncbi:MAG: HAF repeat/PEP-CTERM domain-containing protein, partial [Sulfurimonas sp.]
MNKNIRLALGTYLLLSLSSLHAESELVGLGDLAGGSFFSRAFSVSSDGSVVVGESTSASGLEAFRWTQTGGIVGLGDLTGGSFFSRARDVS